MTTNPIFVLYLPIQTNVSHSSEGFIKHINIQLIMPLICGQESLAELLQTLRGVLTNDQK